MIQVHRGDFCLDRRWLHVHVRCNSRAQYACAYVRGTGNRTVHARVHITYTRMLSRSVRVTEKSTENCSMPQPNPYILFFGGCGRLLHTPRSASCIYSFWHGVIPTSYCRYLFFQMHYDGQGLQDQLCIVL